MMKIYLVNINSIKDEDIKDLSEYRIKKASNYRLESDKLLCLAAGIALNKGLKEYNLKEKDLIVKENKYGKLFFENKKDIKFNLSHSKDTAIAVISNKEVGCDIEKLRKYNEKIANKYFSKGENEFINKSEDKDESFTRIWTLKESFLKAIGIGLIQNMNEISIIPNDISIEIKQNIDERKWIFKEIKLDDNYISICEEI